MLHSLEVNIDHYYQLVASPELLLGYVVDSSIALFAFLVWVWAIAQGIKRISLLQNIVYQKTSWSRERKLTIDAILRILKANGSWMLSFILMLWLTNHDDFNERSIFWLDELLCMFISYKFFAMLLFYLLERTYTTTSTFHSSQHFKDITKEVRKLTLLAVIFFYSARTINYAIDDFWISFAISSLTVLIIIHALISLLAQHIAIIHKFIAKQLPESLTIKLGIDTSTYKNTLTTYVIFLLSHLLRIILSCHQLLLRTALYQVISSRLLWLHLEQKQSEADSEKDSEVDIRYEKWFSSRLSQVNFLPIKTQEKPLKILNKDFNDWQQGKSPENDIALIGKAGIGKTLFIQHWLKQLTSIQHHYIAMPAKTLSAEHLYHVLSQHLNESFTSIDHFQAWASKQEKQVIVLDDVHHCFISNIEGFAGYKSLLELLNYTTENIFWVITSNKEPYRYLNDVFSDSYYFSNTIEIEPWTADEIGQLILNRHKSSKRKLVFDDLLFATLGNDELSTQGATADRCFRMLWEKAIGNPSIAMAIWLNSSIKKERLIIEAGLPDRPSANFLQDYHVDHLFIYASLIRHQSLNDQEAANATRLPLAIAKKALKLGLDNGFLRFEDGRYRIKSLWILQIVSILKGKNYIHG